MTKAIKKNIDDTGKIINFVSKADTWHHTEDHAAPVDIGPSSNKLFIPQRRLALRDQLKCHGSVMWPGDHVGDSISTDDHEDLKDLIVDEARVPIGRTNNQSAPTVAISGLIDLQSEQFEPLGDLNVQLDGEQFSLAGIKGANSDEFEFVPSASDRIHGNLAFNQFIRFAALGQPASGVLKQRTLFVTAKFEVEDVTRINPEREHAAGQTGLPCNAFTTIFLIDAKNIERSAWDIGSSPLAFFSEVDPSQAEHLRTVSLGRAGEALSILPDWPDPSGVQRDIRIVAQPTRLRKGALIGRKTTMTVTIHGMMPNLTRIRAMEAQLNALGYELME